MCYLRRGSRGYLSGFGTVRVAGQLLLADGSVGAPGLAFTSDPDTGFYRNTTNQVSATGGGNRSATFAGFSMDVNGTATYSGSISMGSGAQVLLDPGAVGAPGLAFVGDTDLGVYRVGSNFLGIGIGGGQVMTWQAGLVGINQDVLMGAGAVVQLDPSSSTTDAPLQFSGDPNTGLMLVAADSVRAVAGGSAMFQWAATGFLGINGVVNVANPLRLGNGSTAQNITAVGDQISSAFSAKNIDPDAAYTLTSTPTIDTANHAYGDVMIVKNVDATHAVTLQDETALAGSKVRGPAGANIAIGPRDVVGFMFDGTDWLELFHSTT